MPKGQPGPAADGADAEMEVNQDKSNKPVSEILPKEPTNPKDNSVPKRVEQVEMQKINGKDSKRESEKAEDSNEPRKENPGQQVEKSNESGKENQSKKVEESNEKKDIVDGQAVSITLTKEGEEVKLLSKSSEDLRLLIDHGITGLIDSGQTVLSPAGSSGGGTLNFRKITKGTSRVVNSFREFFVEEWEAFKNEKKTFLHEKEIYSTNLDFGAIVEEWRYDPSKETHWENQKKKIKEDDTFPPLFYSIVIGFIFTVVPNGAIVLDLSAAYEYIFGTWYIKRIDTNDTDTNDICRNATGIIGATGIYKKECFETDPVWGTLTLVLLGLPGLFWSLGIFMQWATYLRKKNPEDYDRKRKLFFFFIPMAAVSMITFPFQLMTISLISCFNNQDHWMNLTAKVGIAEGFFNAHFQYILQLFVFFVKADRFPSFFQYLACFGSLLFLVWSRIESLLLDRGGHRLSPGQKAWWVCRFGPMFLFNSAFKLGSISLILAMLRYNAIWLYGGIVVIWLLLQFLFNENCLPRRFYYLFIGAGLHAVSVAHIQEEVKIIKTHPDSKKNILFVTKLTDIQLKANMWFQNIMWFLVNTLIIITLTVFAEYNKETQVPKFWPFLELGDYTFTSNKVFGGLLYITPTIVCLGIISLILLFFKEFKPDDRKKLINLKELRHVGDSIDSGKRVSVESKNERPRSVETSGGEKIKLKEFPGFKHVASKCGCLDYEEITWHLYESDNDAEHGLVGALSRIFAPLMNIWQSAVDKHVV